MFILELNKRGIIEAAHDISDGGLIVAIFEMCAHSNIGAKIKDAEPHWYFSESQGRYIISVKGDNIKTLNEAAREMRIDLEEVGLSGGETFIAGREHISLKSLKKLYFSGLNELLY
jgi:phosphoribosylformylglycinamidine synthase